MRYKLLRIHESIPDRPDIDECRRHANYRHALRGQLPAEAITNRGDREQLVHTLWAAGWSDVEIATHTMWTSHTVERIRDRLELPPNQVAIEQEGVA